MLRGLCLAAALATSVAAQPQTVNVAMGDVSFVVPAAFTELTREEITAKFPRANAPGRVFGNPKRTVTVAGGPTPQPMRPDQLDEARTALEAQLPQLMPKMEWVAREILTINGTRWIHFGMITPAIDTKIRNDMLMTSVGGKVVALNLNSTVEEYPKDQQALDQIRGSLRVGK